VHAASIIIALMIEAVRTSETSVDNHFTRQYIPEDNSEHEREIICAGRSCIMCSQKSDVHCLFERSGNNFLSLVDTVCCHYYFYAVVA
jgi:hypothetical protein